MGVFIVYDLQNFNSDMNQDQLTDVLLVNLTEISLVVVITQSLSWSLVKYQEYLDSQVLITKQGNSQINDLDLRRSHITPRGLEEDENSCEIPVAMHSRSLLRQIEENQRESVMAGAQRSLFSGNHDIRSIFIPRDSIRDDLNHIQTIT